MKTNSRAINERLSKINNLSKLAWWIEKRDSERVIYDLYCDSLGQKTHVDTFFNYAQCINALDLLRMYTQFERVNINDSLNNQKKKIKDALDNINSLAQTSDYWNTDRDTKDLQLINQIVLEKLDNIDAELKERKKMINK